MQNILYNVPERKYSARKVNDNARVRQRRGKEKERKRDRERKRVERREKREKENVIRTVDSIVRGIRRAANKCVPKEIYILSTHLSLCIRGSTIASLELVKFFFRSLLPLLPMILLLLVRRLYIFSVVPDSK